VKTQIARLKPSDADYPQPLLDLAQPPEISVAGVLGTGTVVAIVGRRDSAPEATAFARDLAGKLARAGVVIVSGGALGIDAAAHRGAMDVGGRTWAVAPTGYQHCYPAVHADLYAAIAESGGAVIWPFPPTSRPALTHFNFRNRVMVALADAVVIVQAGIPSGALNTARHARATHKPLWVVAGPPWLKGFEGCRAELTRGARELVSTDQLMHFFGIVQSSDVLPPPTYLGSTERAVLASLDMLPLHSDELASRTGLGPAALATALLTLTVENVVVEGPDGFFRRARP
jgi:DNA processing protein